MDGFGFTGELVGCPDREEAAKDSREPAAHSLPGLRGVCQPGLTDEAVDLGLLSKLMLSVVREGGRKGVDHRLSPLQRM
jgi:hypothetical protein